MLHKLDDIPIITTAGHAIEKLLVQEEDDVKIVTDLFHAAKEIAKPKALFREVFVEDVSNGRATINGFGFESEVLASNLKNIHRIFAYVCTCGTEVDTWSRRREDYFETLWLDMIKQMFLNDAASFMREHIKNAFHLEKLSSINPGSGELDNWPISQQRLLFDMIGNVEAEIGVLLTESFLMVPIKSTSGILYPSETEFTNCALCGRENCVGRRAEFDRDLYNKTFKKNIIG